MKLSRLTLVGVSIALAGCTTSSTRVTLEEQLQNPLFAERYYEGLVDRMAELEIQKDPIIENGTKRKFATDVRLDALEKSKAARALKREGMNGQFVPVREYAQGYVLFLKNMLYMDTTFEADPNPSLHLYISTIVDPRDTDFPDETALDLGRLESNYGAQVYVVPETDAPENFRSVVLWDTELDRLHSFAQISK